MALFRLFCSSLSIISTFYVHVISNKGTCLYFVSGPNMSEVEIMCMCDLPAKTVTCRKAGEHQGWLFATCPKDNRTDDTACKFFKWICDTEGKTVPEEKRQGQFSRPPYNAPYKKNYNNSYYKPRAPMPNNNNQGSVPVEDLPPFPRKNNL